MADPTPIRDADQRFLAGEKVLVKSTNVAWLRYDEDSQTLFIGYLNGGEYERDGVDVVTALQMRKAKSVGQALHGLQQRLGKFTKLEK